jgi:transporter family-2 protein
MYTVLAIVVGVLTATQARINGQLSHEIHNGIGAGLISNIIGSLVLIAIILFVRKEREGVIRTIAALKSKELRFWEILGGLGGAVFLSIQGVTVPQIGVAIFAISMVGGQSISSLIVDRIGLTPSGRKSITFLRILVAAFTSLAVSIAVYPDLLHSTFRALPVILAITAGVVVSFQQAINSRVNVVSERPLATAFFNFIIGTLFLIIALAINLFCGGSMGHLPSNPLLYLGGVVGLTYVAITAFTLKHIGLLNFIAFSVTGQLIGALLFDWLAPAANTSVSGYLITGTTMTVGAVAGSRFLQLFANKKADPLIR